MCIRDSDRPSPAFAQLSRGSQPVSYTHLDVYKRQLHLLAPPHQAFI
ncbi:hypothetical protein [Erwinia amylovora]